MNSELNKIVDQTDRFWLVCAPLRITSHPPTYIHGQYESAMEEARRLARENPGMTFHVLGSIEAFIKSDVTRIGFPEDITEDYVPF